MAEGPLTYKAGSTSGATMEDTPLNRDSPYIPIRLREINQVAMLNSWATIFVALGSISFSSLIGFVWDLSIGGPMSTASLIGAKGLVGAAAFFLLLFIVLACVCVKSRKDQVNEILSECDGYAKACERQAARRLDLKMRLKALKKTKKSAH